MIYILLISIIINIGLVIIIILLSSYSNVRKAIAELIVKAEQLIPGKTGEQKINWILAQVQKTSIFAKLVSTKTIKNIIENLIVTLQVD